MDQEQAGLNKQVDFLKKCSLKKRSGWTKIRLRKWADYENKRTKKKERIKKRRRLRKTVGLTGKKLGRFYPQPR